MVADSATAKHEPDEGFDGFGGFDDPDGFNNGAAMMGGSEKMRRMTGGAMTGQDVDYSGREIARGEHFGKIDRNGWRIVFHHCNAGVSRQDDWHNS